MSAMEVGSGTLLGTSGAALSFQGAAQPESVVMMPGKFTLRLKFYP
ncbi:MAG TPA: hypothetical protein PLB25_17755 [Rhodoferax sp.]|nr:hypothetical protein [Rhodoferax sp.]